MEARLFGALQSGGRALTPCRLSFRDPGLRHAASLPRHGSIGLQSCTASGPHPLARPLIIALTNSAIVAKYDPSLDVPIDVGLHDSDSMTMSALRTSTAFGAIALVVPLALSCPAGAEKNEGMGALAPPPVTSPGKLRPSEVPDDVFRRADDYARKGQRDRAIQEYNRALALDKNNADAFYKRGNIYSSKGDRRRAIADFSEAIKLAPTDAELWNARCWERAILGELQGALADCSESLKLKPDAANTLDSRGFVYLKLGRLDDAVTDFDAALKLEAKHAGSLFGRGMARLKKGDTAGGKADIDAALALRPDIRKEYARYGVK
jgi:tetratricopeptide (TPR) repeat protein